MFQVVSNSHATNVGWRYLQTPAWFEQLTLERLQHGGAPRARPDYKPNPSQLRITRCPGQHNGADIKGHHLFLSIIDMDEDLAHSNFC